MTPKFFVPGLMILLGMLVSSALPAATTGPTRQRAVFARITTGDAGGIFADGILTPTANSSCALAVEKTQHGLVRDYRPCCPTGFTPVGITAENEVVCLED